MRSSAERAPTDADVTMAALSQLAAVDRVALALVYFYGHTQAQVAAELGVPRSVVRRRVARGLVDLGERLHSTQLR